MNPQISITYYLIVRVLLCSGIWFDLRFHVFSGLRPWVCVALFLIREKFDCVLVGFWLGFLLFYLMFFDWRLACLLNCGVDGVLNELP